MHVRLLVGMLVMMAMMPRPPEGASLRRGAGERRQHELKGAARAIRPVGKVAMIAAGDGKHPDRVRRRA